MALHQMRRDALRRYIVFRIKAVKFLDLGALWQALKRKEISVYTPVGRTQDDVLWSMRTVILSWFALFIDKNGMNVIELWRELFPTHKSKIDEVWSEIEPVWAVVRTFRDRAGFHADKPRLFFAARAGVVGRVEETTVAIEKFKGLFKKLLRAEKTELPELSSVVDEFLDELDKNGVQYGKPRDLFKRHYMFLH